MCDVSTQDVDELMVNVHYYYDTGISFIRVFELKDNLQII